MLQAVGTKLSETLLSPYTESLDRIGMGLLGVFNQILFDAERPKAELK